MVNVPIPAEIGQLAVKTLDQIDPPSWGPPPDDSSPLVRRVHQLRTVPLVRLTPEDVRLLVAQEVTWTTTVPLALGMLRVQPLVSGDYFPGDLLMATMSVAPEYWQAHPEQREVLVDAVSRVDPEDPSYPYFEQGDTEFADLLAQFR